MNNNKRSDTTNLLYEYLFSKIHFSQTRLEIKVTAPQTKGLSCSIKFISTNYFNFIEFRILKAALKSNLMN